MQSLVQSQLSCTVVTATVVTDGITVPRRIGWQREQKRLELCTHHLQCICKEIGPHKERSGTNNLLTGFTSHACGKSNQALTMDAWMTYRPSAYRFRGCPGIEECLRCGCRNLCFPLVSTSERVNSLRLPKRDFVKCV